MTVLAGYILLFLVVGGGFVFINLLVGKLVRPAKPSAEKLTIYECGEPTIGSAWIQFDLRFYVVALLFVIFDVEVAFFFPWAVVFGKANALANHSLTAERRKELSKELLPIGLSNDAKEKLNLATHEVKVSETDKGVRKSEIVEEIVPIESKAASTWARIAFLDI